MDDHAKGEDRAADVPQLPDGETSAETIESYETVDGIVFYDGENPLAWLQSTAVESLAENR
ncbi:hypothetical protein HTSR_0985 [Halodesulfurarchaeum formicicum]|uniref:Uncharacterized protein n=1 Tax=Halodesulfurarchaeum formicicum TaxID=1873524 RepID=A0A1D8S484_9EURY|nr:hypothetical protein [Halodesulfurarchaeum formicicum]AOW80169.1 hypothetical protein HTSR_0985 [Halodesulfurarchaeum formicicum]APE95468.1 hypothetical protein HSR6_1016 [Halodesulfurarchaeum formicicum]